MRKIYLLIKAKQILASVKNEIHKFDFTLKTTNIYF